MNRKEGVAFLIIGIPNLLGSGGAERFFADFFEVYNNQTQAKRNLFFLSDDLSNLVNVGKFRDHKNHLIKIRVNRDNFFTRQQYRFTALKQHILFLNELINFLPLLFLLKQRKIKILHMPLFEDKEFHLLKWFNLLPSFIRPKLVINIVDCRIPYYYFSDKREHSYASKANYYRLFNFIKIDAIYSWYELFRQFAEEKKIIKSNPPITTIKSRFTLTDYLPLQEIEKKENLIIFAGRLDEQKNPLFFLKAIKIFTETIQNSGFKFMIFGKGYLEESINTFISENNLQNFVSLSYTSDLPSVLKKSTCFVSTQEYENFPSLAMAEAMACGNIIVARNVGQTNLFVKENRNGYLLEEDNEANLAKQFLRLTKLDRSQLFEMCKASIEVLKVEHTTESFIKQTDTFWDSVMLSK